MTRILPVTLEVNNSCNAFSIVTTLGERRHDVAQGGNADCSAKSGHSDSSLGKCTVEDSSMEPEQRKEHCLPLRDSIRETASLFSVFVAAGLVVAAPRGIVLLTMRSQVPASQALSDFKSMWAPCRDTKNLFPAYDPSGQMYMWLFTSNEGFVAMGWTIMHVCQTYTICHFGEWAKGTWQRTIIWTIYCLFCCLSFLNFTHRMALHLRLHKTTQIEMKGDTNRDHMNQTKHREQPGSALHQTHLWRNVFQDALTVLWSVQVMLVLLLRFALRKGSEASTRNRSRFTVYTFVAGTLNMLYVAVLLAGYVQKLHILLQLILAKACTALMRFVLLRNLSLVDDEHVQNANMLLLLVESHTSVYVRGNVRSPYQSDFLNTVMLSLSVLLVETLSFCWSSYVNVTRSYNFFFKGINSKTLVEILESHKMHQRQMELYHGHFFLGELLEISICIVIDVYMLCGSVWTQHGIWTSVADFSGSRHWNVVMNCFIRLGIQV